MGPGRFAHSAASGWLKRLRSRKLALCAVVLLLGVGFFQLGSEVMEGETHAWDQRLLHAAQDMRAAHPWLADVMRDLSALGSRVVLTLVTVAAAGYLWLLPARRDALGLALSVSLGTTLIGVLKNSFGRLRPEPDFAHITVPGLSFPSGHAGAAAIVFLSVAVLLADTREQRVERVYVIAVAATVVMLVGISRVVLGVHWGTDVIGGWAMGAGWALMGLLLSRWLGRERRRAPAQPWP